MSWYTFLRFITFGVYRIPFGHDPTNFQIATDKTCKYIVNDDNFYIRYSANAGMSWRYVICAYPPVLNGEKWSMDRLVFNIKDYPNFHESFRSYDDILRFEEEENNRVKEGNKKLTKEQIRRRKQIKDTIQQNSEYHGTP